MTKLYSAGLTVMLKVEANDREEARGKMAMIRDEIRTVLPTGARLAAETIDPFLSHP